MGVLNKIFGRDDSATIPATPAVDSLVKIERTRSIEFDEMTHRVIYMDGEEDTVTFHRLDRDRWRPPYRGVWDGIVNGYTEENGIRRHFRVDPDRFDFSKSASDPIAFIHELKPWSEAIVQADQIVMGNVRKFDIDGLPEPLVLRGTYIDHIPESHVKDFHTVVEDDNE